VLLKKDKIVPSGTIGILLIGGTITVAVQHFRFPNRKKISGIILVMITLCVMGLLTHGIYDLSLMSWWETSYYGIQLFLLFLANLALLLLGINLIRKSRKERSSIDNKS